MNVSDVLLFARVEEQGKTFETGVPVTFRYVRSTAPSPSYGSKFGQDIEPSGRYLLHNEDPGDLPRGWESGTLTFISPLVILLAENMEDIYGPTGWKARLVRFTGKKKLALSRAIRTMGHDGIVTVGRYHHGSAVSSDTREIVDLRMGPMERPR